MTRSEGTSPAHVLLAPGQLSPELSRVLLQRLDLQIPGDCFLRQLSELRVPAGSQRGRLFPEPGRKAAGVGEVPVQASRQHRHSHTRTRTCILAHALTPAHACTLVLTPTHLHMHTRSCTRTHSHSHTHSHLHTHTFALCRRSHTRTGLGEMLQIMPPPHLRPYRGDLLS